MQRRHVRNSALENLVYIFCICIMISCRELTSDMAHLLFRFLILVIFPVSLHTLSSVDRGCMSLSLVFSY